jgi:hypothetical protein
MVTLNNNASSLGIALILTPHFLMANLRKSEGTWSN